MPLYAVHAQKCAQNAYPRTHSYISQHAKFLQAHIVTIYAYTYILMYAYHAHVHTYFIKTFINTNEMLHNTYARTHTNARI